MDNVVVAEAPAEAVAPEMPVLAEEAEFIPQDDETAPTTAPEDDSARRERPSLAQKVRNWFSRAA